MGRPAEAGTRRGLTALGVKDLKGIAGTVRAWAALRQAIAKLPGAAAEDLVCRCVLRPGRTVTSARETRR